MKFKETFGVYHENEITFVSWYVTTGGRRQEKQVSNRLKGLIILTKKQINTSNI